LVGRRSREATSVDPGIRGGRETDDAHSDSVFLTGEEAFVSEVVMLNFETMASLLQVLLATGLISTMPSIPILTVKLRGNSAPLT
jgi:hypothetical protein